MGQWRWKRLVLRDFPHDLQPACIIGPAYEMRRDVRLRRKLPKSMEPPLVDVKVVAGVEEKTTRAHAWKEARHARKR